MGNGPASAPTNVVNETLCHSAGAVAPACPTTTTADRANVQWMSDTGTGETSTYGYDTNNRLHTDTITGGANPRTYTYGYDAAGNRTSAAVTGTSPSSQTLTYNAANQITTTGYTYDGAGNLTAWPGHTATYNGDEQMTTTGNSGVTATYVYAGATQNEVVSESDTTGNTYKLAFGRPDSSGNPEIASVVVGGQTGYVLHDNTGTPVMLQTTSAVSCLYLYDGIGNPIALATSNSTISYVLKYDPYGAATRTDSGGGNGGWLENPYVYEGGIQDRLSGVVKFGARFYNTTTGNWTQQDSKNAPLDPNNGNRYEYAADNPINDNDPSGLWHTTWGDISGTIYLNTSETEMFSDATDIASLASSFLPEPWNALADGIALLLGTEAEDALSNDECVEIKSYGAVESYSGSWC